MSEQEGGRSGSFLTGLLGGLLGVLLLAVGLIGGYLFATGGGTRAPEDEGFVLPPTRTLGVPIVTPRATFTPLLPTETAPAASPTGEVATNPTATPGIVVPSNGEYVTFVVQAERVDAFQGPGAAYPLVGSAPQGTTLLVAGRTGDGLWWLVCCVAEQSGWVPLQEGNLLLQGDVNQVDVIEPPPGP